jgi:hypothetical protein
MVSSVVAAVVTTSAASSVAVSLGGSVASSAGTGGSSVFQLIQAVQFMNIFGKLVKKPSAEPAATRRDALDVGGENETAPTPVADALFAAANLEATDAASSEFRCATKNLWQICLHDVNIPSLSHNSPALSLILAFNLSNNSIA